MSQVEMSQFPNTVFDEAEYHDNFWTTKNQAFKDGNFANEHDFCQDNFEKYHCLHCGYAYTMQNLKPCETYVGPLEKQCCVSSCSPTVIYDSLTVDITTPETECPETTTTIPNEVSNVTIPNEVPNETLPNEVDDRLTAILIPLLFVIGFL